MEKIIITQEEKKALEVYNENSFNLEQYIRDKKSWTQEFAPLTKFSVDQMARLLYEPNSYEIEQPKVKVGEWVSHKKSAFKGFRKVALIKNGLVAVEGIAGVLFILSNIIKTTEEEIFWAELGREKNEIKAHDVVVTDLGNAYMVVENIVEVRSTTCHIEDVFSWGKRNIIKGFYPAESFKEFPKNE